MNKQKFYYQRGMCTALKYNSLNPIMYEAPEENMDYQKKQMACNAIINGQCKNPGQCALLKDAPDYFPYNSVKLYAQKL